MSSTLTKKIIYLICNERKGKWIYFEDIIKNINPEYFSKKDLRGKSYKDTLLWESFDYVKQEYILDNFKKTLNELIKKDIIKEKSPESEFDYTLKNIPEKMYKCK